MSRLCITGLLVLAALVAGPRVAAESEDEARASIGGNRLIAAAVVELDENVDGSAFLAGGRVYLDAEIERNAWIAGGAVEVRGTVGRRLHAGGGEVRIEGEVRDDLRAAGGSVRVGRDARIGGDAALAGGSVEFDGTVAGDLRAYGESVTLNGTVRGDVTVAGESVRIGPGARFQGELRYRGASAPDIDPGAEITGGVRELRGSRRHWADRFDRHDREHHPLLSGALLFGVLLVLLAPGFSRAATGRLQGEPLSSGLLGLALLIGLPVTALLLIVTIIGVPLGLLLLFALLLALLLGMATAALFVGDTALARLAPARVGATGWRLLALLFALLALWLLSWLPIVGGLVVFLLLLAGTGAFAWEFWQRVHDGRAEPRAAT